MPLERARRKAGPFALSNLANGPATIKLVSRSFPSSNPKSIEREKRAGGFRSHDAVDSNRQKVDDFEMGQRGHDKDGLAQDLQAIEDLFRTAGLVRNRRSIPAGGTTRLRRLRATRKELAAPAPVLASR